MGSQKCFNSWEFLKQGVHFQELSRHTARRRRCGRGSSRHTGRGISKGSWASEFQSIYPTHKGGSLQYETESSVGADWEGSQSETLQCCNFWKGQGQAQLRFKRGVRWLVDCAALKSPGFAPPDVRVHSCCEVPSRVTNLPARGQLPNE